MPKSIWDQVESACPGFDHCTGDYDTVLQKVFDGDVQTAAEHGIYDPRFFDADGNDLEEE